MVDSKAILRRLRVAIAILAIASISERLRRSSGILAIDCSGLRLPYSMASISTLQIMRKIVKWLVITCS